MISVITTEQDSVQQLKSIETEVYKATAAGGGVVVLAAAAPQLSLAPPQLPARSKAWQLRLEVPSAQKGCPPSKQEVRTWCRMCHGADWHADDKAARLA